MGSWLQGHHCASPKRAQIFHRHHTVSFSPYVCIPVGGSLPHVGSRWDVAFCTRRNKLVKSQWDVAFCTRRNRASQGMPDSKWKANHFYEATVQAAAQLVCNSSCFLYLSIGEWCSTCACTNLHTVAPCKRIHLRARSIFL